MNAALLALRARLSTDADLIAFFESHYDKTIKHLLGYKKSLDVDSYPILSYVRTKGEYGLNQHDNGLNVSIVLGINDDRLLDDDGVIIPDELTGSAQFLTFSGALRSSQAVELIIKALVQDELIGDFYLTSDFVVFDEIPPNTPFFNTEIAFQLKQRGARHFAHV